MIGTVVVGIGTAGRVRIRDLLSPLPSSPSEKLSLKGFISRRTLENQQDIQQISLDEALSREDIHAAIICTENVSHEENIRKFLEAGKHVCVEYPMTLSFASVKQLCELADKKGKILHEEHIELLTAEYKQLKKDVTGKNLVEGTLHFTGGPLQPGFGFIAFSGIARLTWLVDLFGELTVTSANVEEDKEKKYIKMTAHFQTKDKSPLTWIEERAPGLGRVKNISFRFDTGVMDCLPVAPRESIGLFMQDLNLFGQKLLGLVSSEQLQAERKRILHCLELADLIRELSQACTHNSI
nr:PREDICTED: biliverdin reductase A [Lepisosteus oculatus]